MSALALLQDQFQNYLLKNQEDIKKSIKETASISIDKRLDIYQDAYRSRLIEALGNNFPNLNSMLGSELFKRLCAGYIANYPSTYRSIRWYGGKFPQYLKESGEPFLAEFAEFEWKMTLAFDAADENCVNIEEMAKVPPQSWAKLRFKAHPSLSFLNFNWNIIDIWEAITNQQQPPEPQINPQSWVLWRRDYLNRFYSPTADEAFALEALIKGENFADLCVGLANWVKEEEVGLRAASLLKGWIQSGLISQLIIEDA